MIECLQLFAIALRRRRSHVRIVSGPPMISVVTLVLVGLLGCSSKHIASKFGRSSPTACDDIRRISGTAGPQPNAAPSRTPSCHWRQWSFVGTRRHERRIGSGLWPMPPGSLSRPDRSWRSAFGQLLVLGIGALAGASRLGSSRPRSARSASTSGVGCAASVPHQPRRQERAEYRERAATIEGRRGRSTEWADGEVAQLGWSHGRPIPLSGQGGSRQYCRPVSLPIACDRRWSCCSHRRF